MTNLTISVLHLLAVGDYFLLEGTKYESSAGCRRKSEAACQMLVMNDEQKSPWGMVPTPTTGGNQCFGSAGKGWHSRAKHGKIMTTEITLWCGIFSFSARRATNERKDERGTSLLAKARLNEPLVKKSSWNTHNDVVRLRNRNETIFWSYFHPHSISLPQTRRSTWNWSRISFSLLSSPWRMHMLRRGYKTWVSDWL